jgi:hypothetical protein
MNKYFIQIFREESTVILPGFGALTMTNERTGEIMFMPYLKFDDGKLAGHIAKTEGMDAQDAENMIAKFIRKIQAELDKGESFDIFEFGSFFKNKDGEVEFQTDYKNSKSSGGSADSTVTAAHVPEVVEEVIEEVQEDIPVIEEVRTEEVVEEVISESEAPIDDIKAEGPIQEKKAKKEKKDKKKKKDKSGSKDLISSMLTDSAKEVVALEEKVSPAIEEEIELPIESKTEEVGTTEVDIPEVQIVPDFVPEEKEIKKTEEVVVAAVPVEKVDPKKAKEEAAKGKKTAATAEKSKAAEAKEAAKKSKEDAKVALKADKKEGKVKKKKGLGFWLLTVFLLAIVGGGIWGALNFDVIKPHIPFLAEDKNPIVSPMDKSETVKVLQELREKESTEEEPVIVEDEIDKDTLMAESIDLEPEPVPKPVKEVVKKAPVKEVVVSTAPKGTFHIIVGASSSQTNANKLIEKLKGQGYEALIAGKSPNGLIRISAGLCFSREEATTLLAKVKEEYSSAWLMKD